MIPMSFYESIGNFVTFIYSKSYRHVQSCHYWPFKHLVGVTVEGVDRGHKGIDQLRQSWNKVVGFPGVGGPHENRCTVSLGVSLLVKLLSQDFEAMEVVQSGFDPSSIICVCHPSRGSASQDVNN